MKIGVFAIGIGNLARPEMIATMATQAERLEFATVWAPEHLLFVEQYASKYPYARGADLPVPTDLPLLNPFLALTYAAARTSRIRLATGICLVPEYNPLLLAKICASLDYLSGGRFALGIGIGWLHEEFTALGIPWEHRAKRTREYIEAMRGLERSGVEAGRRVWRRLVRLQSDAGGNRGRGQSYSATTRGERARRGTLRVLGLARQRSDARRSAALSRCGYRRALPDARVSASSAQRGRAYDHARRTRRIVGDGGREALSGKRSSPIPA